MNRSYHISFRLLIWPLLLTIMLVSCGPRPQAVDSDPPNAGQNPVSKPETQDPDRGGQTTLPEPAFLDPGLPLDIEVFLDSSEIRFESFYGLLPELAWSSDGRYLAVFAEKNGYGIWLWDSQINETRRLVQLIDRSGQRLTSLTFFGWDDDDRSILYAIDGIQSEGDLLGQNGVLVRKVGLDGTDRPLAWLPGEGMFIRSWLYNPDGQRLLLHRGPNIWAVDTADGASRRIKADLPVWDGLFWVVFSPTGEDAVYPTDDLMNHRLIILDVATGRETFIGHPAEYSFCPVWSPNGQQIAFLSASANGSSYDFQIGEDGPLPPATRIEVVTRNGQPLIRHTPRGPEKVGACVWSPDSRKIAFLTALVTPRQDNFPEISWRHLYVLLPAKGELTELGQLDGEWITIGDFAPDNDAVFVYNYEAGGGVLVTLYPCHNQPPLVLTEGAVDENPAWWKGQLIFPRLTGNHDDYLDTQLYLHDLGDGLVQLTDSAGWKSGVQVCGRYMAYISADNKSYPYPLTVVVQPLPET